MKRSLVDRLAIYSTVLVLCFAEVALLNRISLFGVRPEVLLVATIFFGFHFGVVYGVEAGLVSGILKDIFSVTGFGINAISFLFIGFLSGYLRKKLIKENFVTHFLLSFFSVYFISIIYALYLNKITGSNISAQFWKACLYKGLYTGCIAPTLFFLLTRIFEIKPITTPR